MPLLHKQSVLGESFSWNGTVIQLLKLVQRIAKDGCTAADQVLNLTVTPKPADAVTAQTNLFWESFSWNGTDYTTTQAGTSRYGCTADQVLNLTVTPKPADAVTTQTICSGNFPLEWY
jgi:hypothetical protein